MCIPEEVENLVSADAVSLKSIQQPRNDQDATNGNPGETQTLNRAMVCTDRLFFRLAHPPLYAGL